MSPLFTDGLLLDSFNKPVDIESMRFAFSFSLAASNAASAHLSLNISKKASELLYWRIAFPGSRTAFPGLRFCSIGKNLKLIYHYFYIELFQKALHFRYQMPRIFFITKNDLIGKRSK